MHSSLAVPPTRRDRAITVARGACGVVLVFTALVLTFAGLYFAGMSDALYTRGDVLGWLGASVVASLVLLLTGGLPDIVEKAQMVAIGVGCLLAFIVARGLLLGIAGI